MPQALCQQWEESERGWGTRPDGFTLHLDTATHTRFVKAFLDRQRNLLGEKTPDEYTRQMGSPYSVEVDEDVYQKLLTVDGVWGVGSVGPDYGKKAVIKS